MHRSQAGDLTAFDQIVRRHMARVRGYLALRAPSPQLVDELAHETFLVAHGKLNTFNPGDPILAWLQTIAWQLLRRELKRYQLDRTNRTRLLDHQSILNDGATCSADLDGRIEQLERCLDRLEPASRELIDLRYRIGLSPQDIAKRNGQSNERVRVALYRVRQQLRRCIEHALGTKRTTESTA